jgi:hypothetical protein
VPFLALSAAFLITSACKWAQVGARGVNEEEEEEEEEASRRGKEGRPCAFLAQTLSPGFS